MSSTFAGGSARREPVTSATIQKMLDENTQLIQAVIDYQNQGEAKKCAQYQQILHRNLVFLATIADSNMNIQSQMQQGSNVAAAMPMPQQGITNRHIRLASETKESYLINDTARIPSIWHLLSS